MIDLLKEHLAPILVIAFLVFGKWLKRNRRIDNRFIPIILTLTGGMLGVIFFKDTDYVLMLAGAGGFSNNLHQIIKGFEVNDKTSEYLAKSTERALERSRRR